MFKPTLCSGCHKILTRSVDINSIIIFLIIYGIDYCLITVGIGKIEAISLLRNADLCKKSGSDINRFFIMCQRLSCTKD